MGKRVKAPPNEHERKERERRHERRGTKFSLAEWRRLPLEAKLALLALRTGLILESEKWDEEGVEAAPR